MQLSDIDHATVFADIVDQRVSTRAFLPDPLPRADIERALALACQARVMVADEPTTALDVVSQAQVLETLATARAQAGMALLFITHDLAAASQVCDRAIVLQAGMVVEEGTRVQAMPAAAVAMPAAKSLTYWMS